MTVEIEMSDAEYNFISECAAENKISVAEFLLNLAREKIEDDKWLKVANETMIECAEVYKALAK